MSDEAPKPSESLLDRAMRQAKEAAASVPPDSGVGQAGLVGAAGAAGVAGAVKDATSPAMYSFHTARAPQATLRVFVDALNALGDHDTRPQSNVRGDQATLQFQQLLPTGNWVTAVTITLVQASEEVNIAASAPSLASVGGAAAQVGGSALGPLGQVLSGNVLGGVVEAAKSVGRITESAENFILSNKIRETIARIGNQLDDEWQTVQNEKRARADQHLMMATCKFCGTPFETAEETQCRICGAPRVQGKPTTKE